MYETAVLSLRMYVQELEIDLEDLPEQVFAEEGSRKRAQPDGVQDLTGEHRSGCA